MGDVILATPAIHLLRSNFPAARIDFVGSPVSKRLFENLPIDRHYEICKSFPRAAWSYLVLLKRIRAARYDLALDASGSSAALGSFIIGFSGARIRIGLKGKWDRWFNLRLDRPKIRNKYKILPALIASMGLESGLAYPKLCLSAAEITRGRARIRELTAGAEDPIVGIFVGGRKARGKRWGRENFSNLADRLLDAGTRPVIFVGPEEVDLLAYFQQKLPPKAPTVFEPDVRAFASLVRNCDLFVACDSGPVHLACALRVRTVAIFLKDDLNRWSPPAELGRAIQHGQASVDDLVDNCLQELRFKSRDAAGGSGENRAC